MWGAALGRVPQAVVIDAEVVGVGGVADHWSDLLPFTTHRIEVANGIWTRDDGVDAIVDTRTAVVLDECGGTMSGKSVVDLGCLEGGFTLAFAAYGASQSLGIEAREISVQRCELARTMLGLDNAEFVIADIKDELLVRGTFDVVFAAGILYHVADPAALLESMRRACSGFVLIDTHIAHPDEASHGCSDVVTNDFGGRSYTGRWFSEYGADVSEGDKENLLWAAHSDQDSFWPLEAELVRMGLDAGFASIEKIDMSDAMRERWEVDEINRVLYIARV